MNRRNVTTAPLSLAEAEKFLEGYRDDYRHRGRQLQLVVGLTNGAGFTAATSKVLDVLTGNAASGAHVVSLIFPSAVFFALGIIAVGLSVGWDVISAQRLMQRGQHIRNHIAAGGTAQMKVNQMPIRELVVSWGLEWLSALLFAAGIAYPMCVLGMRYFEAGPFTW